MKQEHNSGLVPQLQRQQAPKYRSPTLVSAKMEVDATSEVILTETEYPTEDECLGNCELELHLPPPFDPTHSDAHVPGLVNRLGGLTLNRHGDSAVAHSAVIPCNFEEISTLLPNKLCTTVRTSFTKTVLTNTYLGRLSHCPLLQTTFTSLSVYSEQMFRFHIFQEFQLKQTPQTQRKAGSFAGRYISLGRWQVNHFHSLDRCHSHQSTGIESLNISSLGIIASSSPKGGNEDDVANDPDPYNVPNNLAMFSLKTEEGKFVILTSWKW
jgi:hypothetical protein